MEAGPPLPPDDGDELEAGPALPTIDEGDDEDGRFFGGGITDSTARALDYIDELEKPGAGGVASSELAQETKFDAHWLRRTAVAFEKHINKNAEMRARFPTQPEKFIESEAGLDQSVRDLAALGQLPILYEEFTALGSTASLVGLLAHENADIATAAIQTLEELLDEDSGATEAQWQGLADAVLEADLLGLVHANLERLDEEGDEGDREGVYHCLALLEDLCSSESTSRRVGSHDGLLRWLIDRAGKKEVEVSQNKQYAAELIAILAGSGVENRNSLIDMDVVDEFLQLAAAYRKRDPAKGTEEEEYVGNIFEALTCIIDAPAGKKKFLEAEGTELVLIMLKEGKMSRQLALRMLAHACSGSSSPVDTQQKESDRVIGGREVCEQVVRAGGLKPLFTLFMKKTDAHLLEPIVEIVGNMLRLLPGGDEGGERIRTLAKFVEKDYEKLAKLIRIRDGYARRVRLAEEQAQGDGGEDQEENELRILGKKYEAGLFELQQVDAIIAWLVAEDDGAAVRVTELLGKEGRKEVKRTLEEWAKGLDEKETEARDLGEMLGALVEFL